MEKLYYNYNYSDNAIIICIKQKLKNRSLTKSDIKFIREKGGEFLSALYSFYPPIYDTWDTKTQRYLSRKKFLELEKRRLKR